MIELRKMPELELTIRTIEEMVSEMPTESLQKWQGILRTALFKVEQELTNTGQHTCKICFFQEYGYRDELPSNWYRRGDAEICFQHEYKYSEKLLKDAGYEVDAFFPPEIPTPSVGALKVAMDNLPPALSEAERTLDELMDMV